MLLNNNTEGVVKLFFGSPTREFHLREISRLAKISTTAANSVLKKLLKENIITKQKKGTYDIYQANRKDKEFREMKKFYNVQNLRRSGFVSFLEGEFNYPEAIVLFGSASKGEDIEESDIDIFILGTKRSVDTSMYEKKFGRKIMLLVLSKEEFESAKKRNPELVNNIANGIVLYGYLKVL